MSRKYVAPKTASVATRKFFETINKSGLTDQEVAQRAGMHPNTLYTWRSGKAAATVFNMESILDTMGFELVIKPKSQE